MTPKFHNLDSPPGAPGFRPNYHIEELNTNLSPYMKIKILSRLNDLSIP
jgi:hypothetical protein